MHSQRDIHSTAQSFDGAETFFDAIPAPLALLSGPDFIIEAANEELFRLMGRDDLLGKRMPDVVPIGEPQRFAEVLRHVLATGETGKVREAEVRRRADLPAADSEGGSWLDFTCRRILDDRGSPGGILVTAVDVT